MTGIAQHTGAGTETEGLVARHRDVMMRSAPRPLAVMDHGEGAWIVDVEGRRYLDFLGGIAVNSLGYAHPVFVRTVAEQAARMAHVSNYFASRAQIDLAERLTRISGAGESGRVYYGNSGAEAIEAAFKLARLTRRPRVLALQSGFHGRTMGSLSLTGKPALRADFEPLVPGVEHIDSTLDALEQAMGDDVAALVVEPIKGEAGVLPLPAGYLEGARRITAEHGALLIIDEIQTGAGRTGAWFAFQHDGIVPDAIALAKGIGGGFPIGALVTFGAASDLFAAGQHGSTFGGNPLATATADAVLAEIERAGLVENAERRGRELVEKMAAIPGGAIAEVRGRGLLIGVGLSGPSAQAVATRALELGLIVNAANESTLRLAPPLIIGDDEVQAFIDLLTRALEAA